MKFRRAGDRRLYWFVDRRCIEAACWAPGLHQSRGATGHGSSATSSPPSPCCLRNAHHGCPDDRGHDPALAGARRLEGWRPA